ncbi:MAG: hypothetical protein QOE70_1700 [Chthoniobacter sp.]|jgi:hypothetical protein|nr:hypothetical protein [Chthoniobacter sp.]
MNFLRHFLRGGACLLAFTLGLCGVCWAIREALPYPEALVVREKMEHFAQRHDDYDTIFLGSSRIYYQVIPPLFDQAAAEEGLPTKSFNAGVAGMRPPEDAYFLDYLLRTPPKSLRWVFIELAALRTSMDADKAGTVRAVYWHDWPRLVILFKRAIWLGPKKKPRSFKEGLEDLREPLENFIDHVELFVRNQTNFGRGTALTALLTGVTRVKRDLTAALIGQDRRGWVHTGRPEEMAGPQLEAFDRALADRRAEPTRKELGDPVSQQALEQMIARIEKLGATPVLVVPPTMNKRNFFPQPERETKTMVLDFCDLEKFPELYEHRFRLDTDHLNTEGSQVFTRIFVKAWAQEVKRRP